MTTLTIDYYTGKMNLNLDVFIPAKSAQLRLVVDTIVKSKDPEEKTEKFAEVAIVPEEEKKEDSAAETVKEQPEEKTEYPSGRRADIPEKTWIGSRIDGNGFTIYFNPETMRTEIQAIEKYIPDLVSAGFYKTNHGTYNKKLTWKAYRAAVKLSEKWNAA